MDDEYITSRFLNSYRNTSYYILHNSNDNEENQKYHAVICYKQMALRNMRFMWDMKLVFFFLKKSIQSLLTSFQNCFVEFVDLLNIFFV